MGTLGKDVGNVSLMKLLHADVLALPRESLNEFIGKYELRKRILKGKGLTELRILKRQKGCSYCIIRIIQR